jgi:lipoprotein-anchoring transpeptidase ErfK/SrfK
MREELVHRPLSERSFPVGNYDAQKGDEVVTMCRQRPAAAKLERVRHGGFRLLLSLPLAGFLAGCGVTAQQASSTQQASSAQQASTAQRAQHVAARCRSGSTAVGDERVTVAAVVRRQARVYRTPAGRPVARVGRLNQNGFPTVFRVLAAVRARDCHPRWYRVQLPLRPNGVTGYLRARAVQVDRVRTRILVDISARRLTFFRNGKPVLRTTVAVGSSATPTPTGRYYVNQRLIPADATGPFGPGAIGISAFSDVLTGWAQGGPIAIHGTNEPWSIGRPVSNGCIRVRNPVLKRLFAATTAGTPVLIRR